MVDLPRLVIAAPASGHGKTTVATGLLKALTDRGVKASGFKVGPDYIDPSYHQLACGRPGRNLDPVLVGEDLIAPLFVHGAASAEVSIVEGVMGLYDGRTGAADFGSTAHVARLLAAPIVLVIDASAQGRSIAALIHGFQTFAGAAPPTARPPSTVAATPTAGAAAPSRGGAVPAATGHSHSDDTFGYAIGHPGRAATAGAAAPSSGGAIAGAAGPCRGGGMAGQAAQSRASNAGAGAGPTHGGDAAGPSRGDAAEHTCGGDAAPAAARCHEVHAAVGSGAAGQSRAGDAAGAEAGARPAHGVDAAGQSRGEAMAQSRGGGAGRIAGVILNRVGSDRHERLLREACAEVGMPVLGVLRRHVMAAVPSRHLGLVPVAERTPEAVHAVETMAALVAGGVDLSALLAIARAAPPVPSPAWSPLVTVVKGRPIVAVAGGPAFSFGYREQLELLAAAGADVAWFDPLRDEKLPDGTAALVVNGGFPEVYGEQLAANEPLRRQVRELAASGAPIVAECAGLLWLGRTLDGHEMCGVLDSVATMTDRLTLGYRDAVALSPNVIADVGTRVTGHEFHRTHTTPECGRHPAWSGASGGFVQSGVHASYLHTHWAGHPHFAQRFVQAAAAAVKTTEAPGAGTPTAAAGTAAPAGVAGTAAPTAVAGTATETPCA